MLKQKQQYSPVEQPTAKPTLTVLEKGKIIAVNGYKKFEVKEDRSVLWGLTGSLLLHALFLAGGSYIWHVVSDDPAKGSDTAQIFDVELVSPEILMSSGPASEDSTFESEEETKKEAVLQEALPVAKPITKKPPIKPNAINNSSSPSQGEQKQGAPSQSFGISTGTGTAKPNYAQIVAARIAANKSYPRRAKERGIEGKVVIALTVGKSGEVVNSEVVSTDSNLLSSGVDEIVRRASPFPEIPAELNASQVTLQVPIRFNLED